MFVINTFPIQTWLEIPQNQAIKWRFLEIEMRLI